MILFDYGQTLIAEESYDGYRGFVALMPYVCSNPCGHTARDVADAEAEIYHALGRDDPEMRIARPLEVHMHLYNRFVFEYLDMELSVTPAEAERIFWDAAAPGRAVEGIEELLSWLWAQGFRTGVISNLSYSGQALKERIDRILPKHHFEFILASSEHVFRKPSPYIFQLALKKARLAAPQVWFCGDNFACDVEGAHAVGMVPVWFKPGAAVPPKADFAYLHVRRWRELQAALAAL